MGHSRYQIGVCDIWPIKEQLFWKLTQPAAIWIIANNRSVGLHPATYFQRGYIFLCHSYLLLVKPRHFLCNLLSALRPVMRLVLKTLALNAQNKSSLSLKVTQKKVNNQYFTTTLFSFMRPRCRFWSVSTTILRVTLWVPQLVKSLQTCWWANLAMVLLLVALMVRFSIKLQTFAAKAKSCILIGATNNFDCCLRYSLNGGFTFFRGQNV
ncbi:MAG: hypothetical protein ACI9RO_000649 [Alteromonas macleodii]|jgi:hypothetical protein